MTTSQYSAFLNFLSRWAHTHSRPVTCATLLPLAEACGVDLGGANTVRTRQSNLGRLLNTVSEFGEWRIVAGARTRYGATYSCHAVSLEPAGIESG